MAKVIIFFVICLCSNVYSSNCEKIKKIIGKFANSPKNIYICTCKIITCGDNTLNTAELLIKEQM